MSTSHCLTLEDLSRRTRTSPEELRQWRSLGLLGATTNETFGPEDVERALLIEFCIRRGFGPEVIARAEARERILRRYIDQVFPQGVGATYSLAETAAMTGLDAGIVLVASGAGAFWVQADFWVMLAFIALAYYSVGTAALGRSLGAYWVIDRNRRRWKTTTPVPTDRDSLAERIRRLRKLSIPGNSGALGDAARVPWNAILLRIWFLR